MEYFKFFKNEKCEFYPCHDSVDLNCKFCFCPIYHIDCGGDFIYINNGIKDCSNCIKPHDKNGWDYVIEKINKNNTES